MPTTPRNIRFDDDLYKEMMALAGNQLSGAYHIHLACRQYLARLEPIEELAPKPTKPKTTVAKSTDSKYKYLDEDIGLAVGMFASIKNIAPHTKEPNLKKWANTIRLMRDQDKIDFLTIQQVFQWANKDSFWQTNILSPDKLRKQFSKLHAKMVNTNGGQNQPGRNAPANRKLTPVERVRAKRREAEARNGCGVGVLGDDGNPLPLHMDEQRGGRADRTVDEPIEGTYTRSD